ncbi:MAG: hypothetical protein QM817_26890 [Archangium sp.]
MTTKVGEGEATSTSDRVGPDVELDELRKRVAELEAQATQNRDAFLAPLREQMKDLEQELEEKRRKLADTKDAVSSFEGMDGAVQVIAWMSALLASTTVLVGNPKYGAVIFGVSALVAIDRWWRARK